MPCSPLTTPSLAVALITVICVVLTLNVAALKDANVGCVVALVLLLVALLIFTIIIWRQPQSNARLNFKVSACWCLHPSGFPEDLGIAGTARASCQAVTRKAQSPETCLSEMQSPVWKCSGLWKGGHPSIGL